MNFFDTHFHIINPQYPLDKNNGYLPPPFTLENYLSKVDAYELKGGAIVSGSFQGFDQEYLLEALGKLGKGFVGVANIPMGISENELIRLKEAKVVAVRFNLKRGGSERIENMEKLSNQLFERFGWHTELYVDSKDLKDLKPILKNLPRFSIDHLGLSKQGLKELYYWVEKGVKIKATGFGRLDFDPIPVLKLINEIDPTSLLFGTDLPSTRAKTPFSKDDLKIIQDNFDSDAQKKIFLENAQRWYGRRVTR